MISRSQIYVVNLSPTHGREQAGRRPVPVVSADAINRQPLVVTVVVGTDAKNVPRAYPTNPGDGQGNRPPNRHRIPLLSDLISGPGPFL